MLSDASLDRVDRYWSDQLAIPAASLRSRGVLSVPLPETDRPYCLVFSHGSCTCVELSPPHYRRLAPLIEQQDAKVLLDSEWWHRLGNVAIDTVGAAYLGYADASTLRGVANHATRRLTVDDDAALAAFAAAIGPVAWEHSGLGDEPQPIVGCWEAGALVAAAGYKLWGGALAHIGVATHPAWRGRGYGKAVVSTIGEHALAQGYVPQYRTLLANTPSIAIAQALGFQAYATTLFLHLSA